MVFIVAEIGMNHDGSIGQAKALIKAAAQCGVDAVKFQTHIADAETLHDAPSPAHFKDETRYDYFKRTAFSLDQHIDLNNFCKINNVEFISSPFSLEAIDLLEEVNVDTYKVPSGEVNNTPYLIKLGATGKKIILSSGMSLWEELDEAVRILSDSRCNDIVILQCTSEYPCPPEHAGLNIMEEMKVRYGLPVGFSDHTSGIAAATLAVGYGASVIEKHFTLSKQMYGPDSKFSFTPDEMTCLVRSLRDAEKAIENKIDKNSIAESFRDMKLTFEKSIVAGASLEKGTIIQEFHLSFKKPGDGIQAKYFKDLIGKKLRVDVKKDTKLDWSMFE